MGHGRAVLSCSEQGMWGIGREAGDGVDLRRWMGWLDGRWAG